jgi:SlyX protein
MNEQSRLDDVEVRIAHLERGLQELSDVIVRQQKALDHAMERQQRLAERLAALQSDDDSEAATRTEIPPHY